MNKIGIFICNYNGKEYLLNCIESVFCQTIRNFDIHIVDNASTDGSVEAVKQRFGDNVMVICNSENLGGSGGFDRGLQIGLSKQYEYIVLLDNDIILDKKVLETMCSYLDAHKEAGLVGSKVMIMDRPDILQDYGDYLDFERFRERFGYSRQTDNRSLPKVNPCDYVPSCAVMIRAKILRKSGTMPTDNFIYYDDIELCHKIRLAGGSIAALGDAKVWHKGGFRKEAGNTFSKYYFLRNRLHFFAKYVEENEIERFVDVILHDVFFQLAGFYSKGMKEVFCTTMYAFDDFLHQVRGKAAEYKILKISQHRTPFENIVRGKKRIGIRFFSEAKEQDSLGSYQNLLGILGAIQKSEIQTHVWISLEQCECSQEEFIKKFQQALDLKKPKDPLPEILFAKQNDDFSVMLRMCSHVKNVKTPVFPEIYVDPYCNCIPCEEDYQFFTSLDKNADFFADMYRPLLTCAVKNIRKGMKENGKKVTGNEHSADVFS